MADIRNFPGRPNNDGAAPEPDIDYVAQILDQSRGLKSVVVCGFDHDGNLHFASSSGDLALTILSLEMSRHAAMERCVISTKK